MPFSAVLTPEKAFSIVSKSVGTLTLPMEAEMLSECASRKQVDFSLQPFDKPIYFLIFPIRGCKAKISSAPSIKQKNPSIKDFCTPILGKTFDIRTSSTEK